MLTAIVHYIKVVDCALRKSYRFTSDHLSKTARGANVQSELSFSKWQRCAMTDCCGANGAILRHKRLETQVVRHLSASTAIPQTGFVRRPRGMRQWRIRCTVAPPDDRQRYQLIKVTPNVTGQNLCCLSWYFPFSWRPQTLPRRPRNIRLAQRKTWSIIYPKISPRQQ